MFLIGSVYYCLALCWSPHQIQRHVHSGGYGEVVNVNHVDAKRCVPPDL